MSSSSYQKGMVDAIQLWGNACGHQANCVECPVGAMKNLNVTCQDFARQFPEKMLSILKEMDQGQLSYYEEYCTRFPESSLSLKEVSLVTCRKAIFEGYLDCEENNEDACVACWMEAYVGDTTESKDDNEEADGSAFCTNCGQEIAYGDGFCSNCGNKI